MTRFRHTAVSKFGTFRSDSNLKCHFVVVYCGWRNLPEAQLIYAIRNSTPQVLQTMAANENTAAEVPADLDLAAVVVPFERIE